MSVRIRRRDKRIWFVILGIFVAVFLFSFLAQRFKRLDDPVDAASLANFDPGYIISDYQMGNYNSMSEAEIQAFLTAKNPCSNRDYGYYQRLSASNPGIKWRFENGHFICLSEERFGDGEVIGTGDSAAHIIWQAAQDYKINPQVLIVLLQKESSLITDPIPNNRDYRSATGYGCPDTAPCSSEYYGFKNQVRKAASLFSTVLNGGWTNYPLGNNYIQYNPNSGCGGSVVNIRSLATSALYRYTPYQPNPGAIAAGYGTAYCGAYGNRNFYLYFEDWFGGVTKAEVESKGYTIAEGVYQIFTSSDGSINIKNNGGETSKLLSEQISIRNRKTKNMTSQLVEVKYKKETGYYRLSVPNTDLVFDVEKGKSDNGTQIILWKQNNGCNQDWVISPNNDGSYTIISRCSSKVLDATANNDLVVFNSHGGNNQKWTFAEVAESEGKTIEDGVYQIGLHYNFKAVIDAKRNIDNKTGIASRATKDNANQLFKVEYTSDGYYRIVNPTTGLALDVSSAAIGSNVPVVAWSQHGSCNQDWVISPNNDGSYTIISRCSSKVLDATANNDLVVFNSHGGNNQKWTFVKVAESEGKTIEDGVYQIAVNSKSDNVIDIYGGVKYGMRSGKIVMYQRKRTNNANQLFKVEYTSDGYYRIVNPTTGLALDVSSAAIGSNVPVVAWSQHGSCNQDWVISPNNDGSYTIISRCSSKVLDATANNDLVVFNSHGGNNQKWTFVKVVE